MAEIFGAIREYGMDGLALIAVVLFGMNVLRAVNRWISTAGNIAHSSQAVINTQFQMIEDLRTQLTSSQVQFTNFLQSSIYQDLKNCKTAHDECRAELAEALAEIESQKKRIQALELRVDLYMSQVSP